MKEFHLNGEKKIQNNIFNRLTKLGHQYQILDEEYADLKLNDEHRFLLLSPYQNEKNIEIFKGLRFFIKKHNKHLIEEFSVYYSENDMIEILLNDFISRWNSAKSNVEYYQLIFKSGYLTINIDINKRKSVTRSYNVISFSRAADNEFTIIKEKRLIGTKGLEQPDFAMYINGIPLIVWEVKTKQSTLHKALSEYGSKSTYSKFVLCLGTDGDDVFLTGSKKLYFLWKKYGKNIASNFVFEIEKFMMNTHHKQDEITYIQNLINNNVDKNSDQMNQLIYIVDQIRDPSETKPITKDDLVDHMSKIATNENSKSFALINRFKECLVKPTSGLEDIIEELFDSPENLLFYFKYSVLIDKAGKDQNSHEFLINHRIQQYYTLKALDQKLKKIKRLELNLSGKELISELVKHVQRSGKSITIRSCVNLIADLYRDLFNKIYICVPDLTILNVMKDTFQNNNLKVKRIKSRNAFIKSINEKSGAFTCYLYNIQKTKDPDSVEPDSLDFANTGKYLGNDVLFIIDEVHFSQSKTQAAVRANCFPNASFLTFTATPKIRKQNGEIVNDTAIRYADTSCDGFIRYLDELNATDAIKMGIILPVVYENMVFEQNANLEKAIDFDDKTKELIHEMLKDSEYSLKIKSEQEMAEIKVRHELKSKVSKEITEEIIERQVKYVKEQIYNKYLEKALREIEREEKFNALDTLRAEKIKYVTQDLRNKTLTCFSEGGKPVFRPKAFYVVESKKDAEACINIVKALSGNNTNVFDGYRFGVDFSEDQTSTSSIDLLSKLNDLSSSDSIIKKFEAQNEKDDPVDILFIVNKYLMGYDNQELVVVYCDKVINEPAKLYQLITRSATTREGKKQGFFVDLIFGNDNYNTYIDKCLPYYNNGSGTSISTLTKEEIFIQNERLKNKMLEIKSLLGYKDSDVLLDEIEIYNRLLSKDEILDPSYIVKKKRQYFDHFKEINQIMEVLINPKYYMENFDEILILSKVNSRYLSENCPKSKDEDVIFDRDDIKSIIIKSLSFFGYHDLEEINNFKISHTNVKDEKLQGRINFNNVVSDFKQTLSFDRSGYPKGFTDMINEWSEKIMTEADAKLAINQLTDTFIKPFEEKQKEKIELIRTKFDSSISWYLTYKGIEKSLALIDESLIDQEDQHPSLIEEKYDLVFDDFMMSFSKLLSESVENTIGASKNITLESKSFYLKKLVDTMNFSINQLKSFKDYDLVKKALLYDTKRLDTILKNGFGISEEAHQILLESKNASKFVVWAMIALEDYYIELINKTISINEKQVANV